MARQALADGAWQADARQRLAAAAARLAALLAPLGEVASTALFATLSLPEPASLYEHLASRGILIRRFDSHDLLRFGLPGSEAEWQRLSLALTEWKARC